jgi:hypothetical protein
MSVTLGLLLTQHNARSRKRPDPRVELLLLERTLLDPPRAAAAKRWASQIRRAYPAAQLVPYTWHLVSHGPEERMAERTTRTLAGPPHLFGGVQDSPQTRQAWEVTRLCLEAMDASSVVLRTPPSVTPGALGRARIRAFVEARRAEGLRTPPPADAGAAAESEPRPADADAPAEAAPPAQPDAQAPAGAPPAQPDAQAPAGAPPEQADPPASAGSIHVIWEPEGLWEPPVAAAFARELGVSLLLPAFAGGRALRNEDGDGLVVPGAWLRVDGSGPRQAIHGGVVDDLLDHAETAESTTLVFAGPRAQANLSLVADALGRT